MKLDTITMPETTVTGIDRRGKPYSTTFPAQTIQSAPTLGIVHSYMWSDYGPLHLTWREGLLCPFHSDVGSKNIHCCDGIRNQNFCRVGRRVTLDDLAHLPQTQQRRYKDRVVCYHWAYHLINAYWDIPDEYLYPLPDDPGLVCVVVLRRMAHASGWFDWFRELSHRESSRRNWLQPKNLKPPLR